MKLLYYTPEQEEAIRQLLDEIHDDYYALEDVVELLTTRRKFSAVRAERMFKMCEMFPQKKKLLRYILNELSNTSHE